MRPETRLTDQEVMNGVLRDEGAEVGLALNVTGSELKALLYKMGLLMAAMITPAAHVFDGGASDSVCLNGRGLDGGFSDTVEFSRTVDGGGSNAVI